MKLNDLQESHYYKIKFRGVERCGMFLGIKEYATMRLGVFDIILKNGHHELVTVKPKNIFSEIT